MIERKHSHYKKSVAGLEFIDVYRVVELFGVPAGALDHAAKKILCAGNRGHKDLARDVQDIIDSLQRWQEMRAEDEVAKSTGERYDDFTTQKTV